MKLFGVFHLPSKQADTEDGVLSAGGLLQSHEGGPVPASEKVRVLTASLSQGMRTSSF